MSPPQDLQVAETLQMGQRGDVPLVYLYTEALLASPNCSYCPDLKTSFHNYLSLPMLLLNQIAIKTKAMGAPITQTMLVRIKIISGQSNME